LVCSFKWHSTRKYSRPIIIHYIYIYINDLLEGRNSLLTMIYVYADDTKMYRCIHDSKDSYTLQSDINKVKTWPVRWLLGLRLNISKCKSVTYTLREYIDSNYYIEHETHSLDKVDTFKDQGVQFDNKLTFDGHIHEKIKKAYSVLGIIKRNFIYVDKSTFILLYKVMVRPHIEYAHSVWNPFLKGNIENIEKVQKRATKLVISLKHLTYKERLEQLKLPT